MIGVISIASHSTARAIGVQPRYLHHSSAEGWPFVRIDAVFDFVTFKRARDTSAIADGQQARKAPGGGLTIYHIFSVAA